MTTSQVRAAIITGASRGLGLALAHQLARDGHRLVIDARGIDDLERARADLAELTNVIAVPGDVSDPDHRRRLVEAADGRLNLLVNNASILGPSPQPPLADYPLDVLEQVYRTNVIAPLGLIQLALPLLRQSQGTVINITSDAALEPYEGWGGYGSSKAGLEQMSRILAAEESLVRVYWVDPGDMNTRMHQEAYPGDDISDRPPPEASVPGLMNLINSNRPSGRYAARELVPAQ
ncbi:MAG TPA: SDR family oxidoreductase [Acidimicrobiia bacterium]|nr:SDR family oxidoreductase [Acidimicrobiia bacterium]